MGIYIDLLVSRSVTKNEWESVYEEALELVRQLPLAEYRRTSIHGVDTYCLVRTDERTDRLERDGHEVVKCGWRTSGDYETMHSGESYYLPRALTDEDDPDPEAGDAILGAFPAYLDYEWEDKKYSGVYRLWGNKTQGEPYHMYLLAVAALIESRLGKKAFTYGDITKGQFRYAVELANRYLKDKIDLPDRCDAKRLADRISELQLTEFEKARAFEEFYLGNKDAEFGEYIRSRYSATALNEYWRDRFKDFSMDNIAGSRAVRDYLLWGFGLRELCGFADPGKDSEGSGCETFIRGIMDTKLHWKEKDCSDPLRIDQEKVGLYSIYTQLAQVFYAAAANKKVDRYIPIGIIRTELTEGLTGVKCDVNAVIDRYLEEEAAKAQKETPYNTSGKSILGEAGAAGGEKLFENREKTSDQEELSRSLREMHDEMVRMREEEHKKYDICDYEDLIWYEEGYTIDPELEQTLAVAMKKMDSWKNDDFYAELCRKGAKHCLLWLASQNDYDGITMCDRYWDKMFTDIEQNMDSFGRYYTLFCLKKNNDRLIHMSRALVINDDLYNRIRKIADQKENEKESNEKECEK